MTTKHEPVMLYEAVSALHVQPGHWYLDGTFGQGGHTRAILEKSGRVIAFDFDQVATDAGHDSFATEIASGQLILIRENFSYLERELKRLQSSNPELTISGVLFDFGTNTAQLMSADRGLSFTGSDEPLDMRLDQRLGVTAKDLLAILPEKQLAGLFIEFGGEQQSRAIAHRIVAEREKGRPVTTVGELTSLIDEVKGMRQGHLNPSTKVFQALRIAVNTELDNIEQALPQALRVLQPGGKLVTIAFHEGEDRIVKNQMKNWEAAGQGLRTPRDVQIPSNQELAKNPRARSAKLRVFTKKT